MGRKATRYDAALGIERILLEYSDEDHPVSISFIREKLEEYYGIDVSDDALRNKILVQMAGFGKHTNTDKPALDSGWSLHSNVKRQESEDTSEKSQKKARGKKAAKKDKGPNRHYWVEERLFEKAESDYLADTVDSMTFLGAGSSEKLIDKINSLQSCHQRTSKRLYPAESYSRVKPGYYTLHGLIEQLEEAIESHRSISFDYMRYGTEPKRMGQGEFDEDEAKLDVQERQDGSRFEKRSPYRIQFMDGRYYLLINSNAKTVNKDRFKVFRVDLIKNLVIEDKDAFIPLVNEDAPADYFRGAINGYGGRRHNIKMRCSGKAIHYVIERFLEFESFRIYKRANDPDGWYEVQFKAHPAGIEYWVLRFIADIELLEPEKTRNRIKERIRSNAYFKTRQVEAFTEPELER